MKKPKEIEGQYDDERIPVPEETVIDDVGVRGDTAIYRPSAFYFRRALRQSVTLVDAVNVGMTVVSELEFLKQEVRDYFDYEPTKCHVLRCEVDEKNKADAPGFNEQTAKIIDA